MSNVNTMHPDVKVPTDHLVTHEWSDAEGKEFDSFYCGCRGWD